MRLNNLMLEISWVAMHLQICMLSATIMSEKVKVCLLPCEALYLFCHKRTYKKVLQKYRRKWKERM
jgi:hypothetical protein